MAYLSRWNGLQYIYTWYAQFSRFSNGISHAYSTLVRMDLRLLKQTVWFFMQFYCAKTSNFVPTNCRRRKIFTNKFNRNWQSKRERATEFSIVKFIYNIIYIYYIINDQAQRKSNEKLTGGKSCRLKVNETRGEPQLSRHLPKWPHSWDECKTKQEIKMKEIKKIAKTAVIFVIVEDFLFCLPFECMRSQRTEAKVSLKFSIFEINLNKWTKSGDCTPYTPINIV